jgi:hypothetical protein
VGKGGYTNREIGDVFGATYTFVSHIVKKPKGKMKTDRDFLKNYALLNSTNQALAPTIHHHYVKLFT